MIAYAVFVFATGLVLLLDLLFHRNGLRRLRDAAETSVALPRLSVIVAARDEVGTIQETAEAILGQEYPDLEVILVDDRSVDGTGAAMDAMAAAHPDHVRVIHITDLPPRWLGKNHALWAGSRVATGEWLLFTDGDVILKPGTLRRAAGFAVSEGLDHLAVYPEMLSRGYLLGGSIAYFIWSFHILMRPYRANSPRSRVGAGVGAFNLVRRAAYEQAGTHVAISLRPDDDMRLGQRLKRMGFKQRLFYGQGTVQVDWYPSLKAMLKGLQKNMYAALDYRPVMVAGALVSIPVCFVAPYLLVWVAGGWARLLLAGTILSHFAGFVLANRSTSDRPWRYLPLFPVLAAGFVYMLIWTVGTTVLRGGIDWRGTFYPLRELRSQTGFEGV